MSAVVIGPPPLYGTCVRFVPVRTAKSAPARCVTLPTPEVPYANFASGPLRELDQLLHRLRRQRGIDDEQQRLGQAQVGDRREAPHRVERQLAVDAGIDGEGAGRHEQRVAVRIGVGDDVGRQHAVRAGAVVEHERLPELRRELLRAPRARSTSGAPPGANPSTSRTGRSGKAWAVDASENQRRQQRQRHVRATWTSAPSSLELSCAWIVAQDDETARMEDDRDVLQ